MRGPPWGRPFLSFPTRQPKTLKPCDLHVGKVHGRISRWRTLSSKVRRRIVLGSLFGVALAARDAMLLLAAASMFALSELAPVPASGRAASG